MIRRILDFVYVLLFAWASMIFGVWLIDVFIVPIDLGNAFLTGFAKVTVSALLVLVWLWLWRDLVRTNFWRALRKK